MLRLAAILALVAFVSGLNFEVIHPLSGISADRSFVEISPEIHFTKSFKIKTKDHNLGVSVMKNCLKNLRVGMIKENGDKKLTFQDIIGFAIVARGEKQVILLGESVHQKKEM